MREITSNNLDATVSEAYKLREKKEHANAFQLATACLSKFPQDAKIHSLMGVLLFDEKKISEATKSLHAAISLEPNNAEYYFILAQIEKAAGEFNEAIKTFKECLKRNPKHIDALFQLGSVYEKQQKWDDALSVFQRIIAIDSANAKAYYNIGVIYHMQTRLREAISYYEKSLNYSVDVNTLANLGAAYTKDRQLEKAIVYYERALALNPKSVTAMTNLGGTYIEMGNLEKAQIYLRQSLALNPRVASHWRNLTLCSDYQSEENPDIAQIQKNLITPGLSEEEKVHYYFALGNIYDKLKKYANAFAYYQKGNELQSKLIDFKPEIFANHVQQVIKLFKEISFEPFILGADSDPSPIFIVGAPRSGKSLLETLLSVHPSIYAAGEVGLAEVSSKMPEESRPKGGYPFWVKNLTKEQAKAIRDFYYSRLGRDLNKDKCKYIIDTMPGNFLFFGLLYLLFPKAKFIVCQRSPLDVGLSIYFKYFVEGHGYSYDLRKIGLFYQQYQRIISFWKEKLPDSILEVSYEDLMNHPQETLDSVMQYLGLRAYNKFDFSKLKKDKLQYSQHYEKFLSPLKEALETKIEIEEESLTHLSDDKMKMIEAYRFFEDNSFEDAKKICKKLIQSQPNQYSAYHLLGMIETKLKNYNLATKYYKRAIEINPEISQIYFDLSALCEEMNLKMEAEQYLSKGEALKVKQAKLAQALLTAEQQAILFAPFTELPKKLAANETRLLLEGKIAEDNTSDSFITRSWDQYFSDLSHGSYRMVPEEGKYAWRIRAWHFLFKNLALVETMLQSTHPQVHVLDIGCSSGYLRRILEGNIDPSLPKKIFYWGLDIRRDMLERAVNGIEDIESGAKGNLTPSAFLLHDVQYGLPFKDSSFDFIVNFEMIKYLPIEQGKNLLLEMKRVLQPNGLLYLSTTYQPDQPGYMQSVPFEVLEKMLTESGFTLLKRRGSQSSIQSLASHLKPAHVALVKDLLTVHPPEVVGAMITPLYPFISDQVTFVCKANDSIQ